MLQGYKRTSSGNVTTYFNRELSAADKAILGDTAPKRISPSPSPSATAAASVASPQRSASAASGSAWNAAGTWEERSATAWANETLRRLLLQVRIDAVGGDKVRCRLRIFDSTLMKDQIRVVEVKAIEGDASVAIVRGKKKLICDFTLDLGWNV